MESIICITTKIKPKNLENLIIETKKPKILKITLLQLSIYKYFSTFPKIKKYLFKTLSKKQELPNLEKTLFYLKTNYSKNNSSKTPKLSK